ncbi:hypothetical protein SAMN05421493_11251 [Pseudobutyrivibrio sp. 49]|uniref:hypothetical protein n=1 Tax=Pseudobutyrivibrio sp. 49 TaxID=1855344 RepID=UPI00087ED763|nr:hypothetical protein [Pseudobutyrivibrio sp. 49]SDI35978.1 hypothetical protein SAMN05421493_11251 [Pseudobutyrivibrio sp. 49]
MGLSELYAQLSHLNSRKRELEYAIGINKKRLSEVEAIKKNLISFVSRNYTDVNSSADGIDRTFHDGLDGPETVYKILFTNKSLYEQDSAGDSNLSSCVTNLTTEIKNTTDKLEQLRRELDSVNSSIRTTEAAIAAEKRRLEEEARRQREAELAAASKRG